VADAHRPGVEADADVELRPAAGAELLAQLDALALHLDGGDDALARVVGVGHRSAPERHYGVADVLVERAAVVADDAAHRREVLVDVLLEVLRAEHLRDAGETAN